MTKGPAKYSWLNLIYQAFEYSLTSTFKQNIKKSNEDTPIFGGPTFAPSPKFWANKNF